MIEEETRKQRERLNVKNGQVLLVSGMSETVLEGNLGRCIIHIKDTRAESFVFKLISTTHGICSTHLTLKQHEIEYKFLQNEDLRVIRDLNIDIKGLGFETYRAVKEYLVDKFPEYFI